MNVGRSPEGTAVLKLVPLRSSVRSERIVRAPALDGQNHSGTVPSAVYQTMRRWRVGVAASACRTSRDQNGETSVSPAMLAGSPVKRVRRELSGINRRVVMFPRTRG